MWNISNPPRQMLLVHGDRPFDEVYHKINSRSEKYEIIKRIHCNAGEEKLKQALIDTYFNRETGNFFDNIQGANAYGLDIGLGDERTLRNLVCHYEKLGHFDTGFLGTDILLDVCLLKG